MEKIETLTNNFSSRQSVVDKMGEVRAALGDKGLTVVRQEAIDHKDHWGLAVEVTTPLNGEEIQEQIAGIDVRIYCKAKTPQDLLRPR